MTANKIDYASLKGLPVGKTDLGKIFENNCYYVDKTPYIKTVIKDDTSEVLLIARPRRFGKSLAMDTFYKFLQVNPENPEDTSFQDKIFKNTKIYADKEFCREFMGKFPVILISLKAVTGDNFALARSNLAGFIAKIANRHEYLLHSSIFNNEEKKLFSLLKDSTKLEVAKRQSYLEQSLLTMTEMLYRYYGKKVVVLIDEYDVPIAKSYEKGYYDKMIELIRNLFLNVLKENPYLQKAVLTGCLRVSKESIFTGLNNLKINTVTNDRDEFAECMGFTKDEVKTLLSYYHLLDYEDVVKDWYDGYRIFKSEIFCPWDVINYLSDAKTDLEKGNDVLAPQSYWSASSSNNVIQQFMPYLDENEALRMQTLYDGGQIVFQLNELLNYNEIGDFHRANDFWNLLLYTGYLTSVKNEYLEGKGTFCTARIPNKEIREAFNYCITGYYESDPVKTVSDKLLNAFFNGEKKQIRQLIESRLKNFVSLRDLHTKAKPENFYHGFLNGLFAALYPDSFIDYVSNTDTGDGYADIKFSSPDHSIGVVIELKSTKDATKLAQLADQALDQIREKNYIETFVNDDDVEKVYCYGIAFCRRRCQVRCEEKNL